MSRPGPSILAFASIVAITGIAGADDLYFAEITPGFSNGHVSRIRTDGTGYTRLIETGSGIRAVAVDPRDRKVYWTDVDNFVIARADLDGSNPEDIVTSGLIFPSALTIDAVGREMYWLDQDNWLARSGLDGSGFITLSETVTHRGIDLDLAAGKMYWSTSDTLFKGKILRANLDGTQPHVAVTSLDAQFKPNAIALDVAAGKIYWTDYVIDVVSRSNLDGTNVEIIWAAGANHNPRGIALDIANSKVYWGQDNDFDGTSGRIMRANLDGSNPQVVITDIGLPNYLALLTDAACLADLNGDGVVDFADYLEFLNLYDAGDLRADFNRDGIVDFADYLEFLNHYDAGC
ncbi:MAG: hypothetical protein IT436_11370 [Phycisphaerales bacterium]|nr:hypothetical protein [Phycisphaerales bacterium]